MNRNHMLRLKGEAAESCHAAVFAREQRRDYICPNRLSRR